MIRVDPGFSGEHSDEVHDFLLHGQKESGPHVKRTHQAAFEQVNTKKQHPTSKFPITTSFLTPKGYSTYKGTSFKNASFNRPTKALSFPKDAEMDIHQLACDGNIEMTRSALEQIPSFSLELKLNMQDNYGYTPLHYAAENKHIEMCKLLVETGADVDVCDRNAESALHLVLNEQENMDSNLENSDTTVEENSKSIYNATGEVVKYLLEQGARVDIVDIDGCTPLFYASRQGNVESAKLLIEASFYKFTTLTARGKKGMTPLHIAAEYGHVAVAKLLIEEGAQCNDDDNGTSLQTSLETDDDLFASSLDKDQLNITDDDGFTPLHYAIMYKHVEMCKLLVENLAYIDVGDYEGRTALHLVVNELQDIETNMEHGLENSETAKENTKATVDDMIEVVKFLLDGGACVVAEDNNGLTPLHYAARNGHVACSKLLIEKNIASIRVLSNQEMTPLHIAAEYDHVGVARLLIDEGAEIRCNNEITGTPLHLAAAKGNLKIVELILDNYLRRHDFRVDIRNERDNDGNSPLHLAVENGHLLVTQLIVNSCRQNHLFEVLNAVRTDKETPLHIAAKYGHLEITKFLIEKEAKVNERDQSLSSPLILASQCNHYQVAEILMNSGARIDIHDSNHMTALMVAAECGHKETIEVLLKKQYEQKHNKIQSDSCNTPLHCATIGGYCSIVKILLDAGAVINAKNEYKQTPLHLAAESGQLDIVRELVGRKHEIVRDIDKDLNTPFYLAALGGKTHVVRELVQLGADYTAINEKHMMPIDCCAVVGMHKSATVLLNAGSPVDPLGKTKIIPLQLACQEGHTEMVKELLRWNANIAHRSFDGNNALDFAIDSGNTSCALVIIEDEKWKKALRNRTIDGTTGEIQTPMRKLIRNMPEIAELVFKKCMKEVNENDDNKEVQLNPKIKCNYEFLDDEFLCTNWLSKGLSVGRLPKQQDQYNYASLRGSIHSIAATYAENSAPLGRARASSSKSFGVRKNVEEPECQKAYDKRGRIVHDAIPYTHDSNLLKKNHSLNIMVEAKHIDLLRHPLVVSLLNHKWRAYGRYVYYLNLLLYLIFMGIFNSYMLTMPPPYSIDLDNVSPTCMAIVTEAQPTYGSCYNYNSWGIVAKYIILAMAGISLLKELYQAYSQRTSYFLSMTNILEVSLYVFAILTVYSDTNSAGPNFVGIREDWQWQVGAVSIFLSWMVLIMFIRNVPRFGIFVIMFNDVLRTFIKFFVVFVLFIFGFALSFHCLLQNQYAFRQWWIAVIKTSIMMTGEIQFDEIFLSEVAATETGADNHTITVSTVNYRAVSYILFVVFIIIMSIIIMNLLVGLAVDDIKAVQDNAELESLAMQVKLILDVEYTLPRQIRRWVMRRKKTFLRNDNNKRPSFTQWLLSMKKPNYLSITRARAPEKTKLEEMETKLDRLQNQVKSLRRDFGDRTSSIESLANAIAAKLEVTCDKIPRGREQQRVS